MNKITRIASPKQLLNGFTDGLEKGMLLRPEYKSAKWMTDLVSKFIKTEELILDTCTGTFGNVKKRSQLPEHRWSNGYDKDYPCF